MGDKPARVLHIFRCMNRGGAETFMMNVYRSIDKSEVLFDFAVTSDEPCHYDEEIQSLGGRIFRLPEAGMRSLLAHLKALSSVLRRNGPYAAVHSHVHFFSGLTLRTAYRCGVPVRISHSHTIREERKESILRSVYRHQMRSLIRLYATRRIACSNDAGHALFGSNILSEINVEVLPNGIDPELFLQPHAEKKEIRKRLSLPEDHLLIGQIARFDPVKNHIQTLEIFESLLNGNSNAHLVFAGDGPLRPSIEALVKQKQLVGKVTFLGVLSNIPDLLHALDLLLVPSLFEGLSLAVIEAQAAGVPLVCSDQMSDDSDLGIGLLKRVVLSESAEIWAEAVVEALDFPAPAWEARLSAITARGYDSRMAAGRLKVIYAEA